MIADDNVLVRTGLGRLLEQLGHEVAGEAMSATQIAAVARTTGADLAIIDIRMPPHRGLDGLRAAEQLRRLHPGIVVLILSNHLDVEFAEWLVETRAPGTGYLLKESLVAPEVFSTCLQSLECGGTVVDPAVLDALIAHVAPTPLRELSTRELEVLGQMALGRSDRGIAQALSVSTHTVATHVRRIFAKLQVPDGAGDNRRVQAVLRWLDAERRRTSDHGWAQRDSNP